MQAYVQAPVNLNSSLNLPCNSPTCTPPPTQSVRALAAHPGEATFSSAGADNIKKFKLPGGEFLHNTLSQQR